MNNKFKHGDKVYCIDNLSYGFEPMVIVNIWSIYYNDEGIDCKHPSLGEKSFNDDSLAPFSKKRQDRLERLKQAEDRIKEIKEEMFAKK